METITDLMIVPRSLTFRGYIATAALSGLCVHERFVPGMDLPSQREQVARKAVAYADALLRELDKC